MTQLAENINKINLAQQAALAAKAAKTKPQAQKSSLLGLVNHPKLAAAYFRAQHFMMTGAWQMSDATASPPFKSSGPRQALQLPLAPEPPIQGPKKDPNGSKVKKALVVAGSSVVGALATGAITVATIILFPAAIVVVIDPALLIALGLGAGGMLGGTGSLLLPRLLNGSINKITKRVKAGYGLNTENSTIKDLFQARRDLATLEATKQLSPIKATLTNQVKELERRFSLRLTVKSFSAQGGKEFDVILETREGLENMPARQKQDLLNESFTKQWLAPYAEQLGTGAYSEGYLGQREDTGAQVAVKVIKAEEEGTGENFLRGNAEAKVMKKTKDEPNIVTIEGAGNDPRTGRPILVMELMDQNVKEKIQEEGKVDPLVSTEVTIKILEGLQQLLTIGAHHRDLKPDNVFLNYTTDNEEDIAEVKLGDMGLVKITTTGGRLNQTITIDKSNLTIQMHSGGAIGGTIGYMAPELVITSKLEDGGAFALEKKNDYRTALIKSDMYSVGVMLYEMITGRLPISILKPDDLIEYSAYALVKFGKTNLDQRITDLLTREHRPIAYIYDQLMEDADQVRAQSTKTIDETGIDKYLLAIVQKAMAYNPTNRYESFDDMIQDLAAVAKHMKALAKAPQGSTASKGLDLIAMKEVTPLPTLSPDIKAVEGFFGQEEKEVFAGIKSYLEDFIPPFPITAETRKAIVKGLGQVRDNHLGDSRIKKLIRDFEDQIDDLLK